MVRYQPPKDWQQWVEWLAAGLHGRSRWRLSLILMGMLFAKGRRTVTSWLRAAGIHDDFADYYYFLGPLGHKSKQFAQRLFTMLLLRMTGDRVVLVVDDTPTQRYGPQVQGAGIHHNPTPGPADQKFLYGHIWVTISLVLRHPWWQTIGLPLVGLLYVRAKDIAKLPRKHHWQFRTKLELAAKQVQKLAALAKLSGKTVWVAADGAYAKLRVFETVAPGRRGGGQPVAERRRLVRSAAAPAAAWPRSATAVRHEADFAGPPRGASAGLADGRVLRLWKAGHEDHQDVPGHLSSGGGRDSGGDRPRRSWLPVLLLDRAASHGGDIIEAFADRAAIEQDFHDVKEVWAPASSRCATSGRISPHSI